MNGKINSELIERIVQADGDGRLQTCPTTINSELIERIVQEVIRRLVERGVVVGEATNDDETETEFAVSDRVITLATIDGRLIGVKRLLVGSHSIVTPAVKDELNNRSIELCRR